MPVNPMTSRSPLTAILLPAALAAFVGCTGTVSPDDGSPTAGAFSGTGSSGGGPTGSGGKSNGGAAAVGGTTVAPPGGNGAGGAPITNPPASGPRPVHLEGHPIYTRFLRLTNDQWENSVRDILRLSAPTGLSDNFLDAVAGNTDFDNNERVVFVDNTSSVDFQAAAEAVADRVTASDQALQAVVATTDAATFIKTFGRRAFRRPLTDAEVTTYQAVYSEGSQITEGSQSAFTKGARWVISTMLQSPNFLYRSEMADAGAPLSGYEMAAKLALWLNDTTPSDALLDAANSLATADGAAEKAMELLGQPAAINVMRKFHAQLYKFALYDSIAKTGVTGYTEAMNPEFKEASYLFFDRVFSQNLGVKEILTSTVGFAGPNMAPIYGVSVAGTGVTQVDLPGRSGYFSQAPFLTLWARNNDPDTIHRGARLNLDTLCADPGSPPQITLPTVPAPAAGQTNREVVHGLTIGCAKECHGEIINPIGFAFENFDGLGRIRTTDNGQPVNTASTYPFKEGTISFAGANELMQLMASGSQAHECWAKKMTSYALERDLVEADRPLVEALGAVSRESAGSLKQVMLALVKHDVFRTRVGGIQ
jgi:hypothetical protein